MSNFQAILFFAVLPTVFSALQLALLRDNYTNSYSGAMDGDDLFNWLFRSIGSGIFYPVTLIYFFFCFLFWLPGALSRTTDCKNCHNKILKTSTFCSSCGKPTRKSDG